jgi:hypothetical protein
VFKKSHSNKRNYDIKIQCFPGQYRTIYPWHIAAELSVPPVQVFFLTKSFYFDRGKKWNNNNILDMVEKRERSQQWPEVDIVTWKCRSSYIEKCYKIFESAGFEVRALK